MLFQPRHTNWRNRRYGIAALLWVVLATSSFAAAPVDDLGAAVTAGGATDVAQAPRDIFLRAFTSVALRVKLRDLPDYVGAAIKMRPDLTGRIVAKAIRVAVRGDRTSNCATISRIIRAAITASGGDAVNVAKAAIAANPVAAHCIIDAASEAAPDQQSEIAALGTNFSLGLLSAITATSEVETRFGTGTMNPANLSKSNSTVVSPEQPTKP
jgi:hypothetical protein